jgi:hypothetical protein
MKSAPIIGQMVQYTNLGDKDGKFPPEIQAAVITGVYRDEDPKETSPGPGNNDPANLGVVPANALGDVADAPLVDLKVFYRTGVFDMKCVPFSEEPKRGHWSMPVQ